MFSRELLGKIRASTDLISLAEEYGAEIRPAGYNIWQSHCPHPDHDDRTPSFRIWRNKDNSWSWSCMGCHCDKKNITKGNYGTDCFAFVQWITDYNNSRHKLTFVEAVKYLAKRAGIPLEPEKYFRELKQNFLKAEAYHKSIPIQAIKYLLSRGLDKDDIIKWKVGFTDFPELSSWKNSVPRIVFPLIAQFDQVVGFSSRRFSADSDSVPKYINSPNSPWFQKGKYLYGIHRLDDSLEYVIITEGVFDVILAYKYGLKNVLAPLGTSFTEDHANILKTRNKIPVFCMDGDEAGLKSTLKAIEKMSNLGVYSRVVVLPEKMDLADIANTYKNDLPAYFDKKVLYYWQYILKDVTEEYENKLQELKMKFLPYVKEAIKGVGTAEEKIMMTTYLKERLNIVVQL